MFCKQGLPEKFAKFAGPEACDVVKKSLQYSCFPVNLVKFLSCIFTEQLGRLLLIILNYIIWYQTQMTHLLLRKISPTLYEFS